MSLERWIGIRADIKKDTALGTVYTIHVFYLRIILHHVCGPNSFNNLKIVNYLIYPTFQAACGALGLLKNDDHKKDTLADASICQSFILVLCHPS